MKRNSRAPILLFLATAAAYAVTVVAAERSEADRAVLTLGSLAQADGDSSGLAPDKFEPDEDRAAANRIGIARPPRPGADLPARIPFELQAHTVYPRGDQDWLKLGLARDSLVRIRTACGFPTIFNGAAACDNPPDFDTIVTLWYTTAWSTTGLCNNTGDESFPPGNITTRAFNACNEDLDCDFNGNGIVFPEDPDDLINPLPDLPACLPWALFPADQRLIDPDDNPLINQDDADAVGGNLGSDVTICLPRTRGRSPSSSVQADPARRFDWYVRANGWSDSGVPADSDLTFEYEIWVQNLDPCRFEQEPNNAFEDLLAGDDDDDDDAPQHFLYADHRLDAARPSVHGIYDLSATSPDPDVDLFALDVPEAGVYVIETDGYDPIAVDTFIELWIGPDDSGGFLFTGLANDDISLFDRRSRLEVPLVPACEALGVDCRHFGRGESEQPQPSYFVSVSSAFVVPNFPYELRAYRAAAADGRPCKSRPPGTMPAERGGRGVGARDCPP